MNRQSCLYYDLVKTIRTFNILPILLVLIKIINNKKKIFIHQLYNVRLNFILRVST